MIQNCPHTLSTYRHALELFQLTVFWLDTIYQYSTSIFGLSRIQYYCYATWNWKVQICYSTVTTIMERALAVLLLYGENVAHEDLYKGLLLHGCYVNICNKHEIKWHPGIIPFIDMLLPFLALMVFNVYSLGPVISVRCGGVVVE